MHPLEKFEVTSLSVLKRSHRFFLEEFVGRAVGLCYILYPWEVAHSYRLSLLSCRAVGNTGRVRAEAENFLPEIRKILPANLIREGIWGFVYTGNLKMQ